MNQQNIPTYSAFIYEINDRYMADCSMLNLVSHGITAQEAIKNLKDDINLTFHTSNIQINPVFERR